MITFELHHYNWHYMHYIEVTFAVTYKLHTALHGLLHMLWYGSLHDQLHHHDWHYMIMNIITWITLRLHTLLHTHYNFYYMACYIVDYMEHYITNYIIMIDITWITLSLHILLHTHYIGYYIAWYKSITWIITYDFMSDYIHFTSLSCNYMPPSAGFGGVSLRN